MPSSNSPSPVHGSAKERGGGRDNDYIHGMMTFTILAKISAKAKGTVSLTAPIHSKQLSHHSRLTDLVRSSILASASI